MTEDQTRQLGELFAQAREGRGFSYGELAARADIDKGWIHRIENGRVSSPDPALLTRLGAALGIDPARLDRVSDNYVANSMPDFPTYLRSKEKLPLAALREAQAEIDRIRAKYKHPRTDGETAGAP